MLLAQADRPAARALCAAMGQGVAENRRWVYYAKAPLLLVLRLSDLRKAGCPLQLPPSRLQTAIPAQEVWIEAARRLEQMESAGGTPSDYWRTADLLRKLAANEFSLLASAPPLIYHNDLTASVRRFYWSEELGYVLWLRLYLENERERSRLGCRGNDAKQECIEK
jgi:hypothetical protein